MKNKIKAKIKERKEDKRIEHNFLPQQYRETGIQQINHNYLKEQFADYKEIFNDIEKLVQNCDYTLGKHVNEFESNIAKLMKAKFVIGVASGTDALFLSLKAAGVKPGGEVITTPYTFHATIGAIVAAGAKPVFVDVRDDYNINPDLIEKAITNKTKAILPVHWSGLCCDMDRIMKIAQKHKLAVVEDACHAINASYHGKAPGTFGDAGCFSMHPLKNLNVWGDGGFIVTNSKEMHDKLALLRNHGLINRDECAIYGYNSRLDSLQAIVANHLLKKIDFITDSRIRNAKFYDQELAKIPEIIVPKRSPGVKQVFHIYVIRARNRDKLQEFLVQNGIDAKVHYPIPMHLQPAAKQFGYKRGDFTVAEAICDSVISLPVHEFITKEQQEYVITKIKEFYKK
jgi:aminotransferase EvaB